MPVKWQQQKKDIRGNRQKKRKRPQGDGQLQMARGIHTKHTGEVEEEGATGSRQEVQDEDIRRAFNSDQLDPPSFQTDDDDDDVRDDDDSLFCGPRNKSHLISADSLLRGRDVRTVLAGKMT
jgi:hypothetical protein